MAISFVFITSFSKKLFSAKRLNLKIESSASSRGQGKTDRQTDRYGSRFWGLPP
jgi:hypothetical protein